MRCPLCGEKTLFREIATVPPLIICKNEGKCHFKIHERIFDGICYYAIHGYREKIEDSINEYRDFIFGRFKTQR